MIVLAILSAIAGLAMIAGAIWMLFKNKMSLDAAEKDALAITIGTVKINTTVPALGFVVIGALLLGYPIEKYRQWKAESVSKIELEGKVIGDDFPVEVNVLLTHETLHGESAFVLVVPVISEHEKVYRIVYRSATGAVQEQFGDLHMIVDGKLPLDAVGFRLHNTPRYATAAAPVPANYPQTAER